MNIIHLLYVATWRNTIQNNNLLANFLKVARSHTMQVQLYMHARVTNSRRKVDTI